MITFLSLFGKINPPPGVSKYTTGQPGSGLIIFFNNLLKLLVVVAGLFALLQLILAGYGFISASGDPKRMQDSWNKIWQSALGLLVVACSFVLAAVLGKVIFGDPGAILHPKIYGP